MDKELAMSVWNDLHPLPASVTRLRFNGKTDPVYSVSVNAQEMGGRELESVLKIVDAHGLEVTARQSDEWRCELLIYKEVAASA